MLNWCIKLAITLYSTYSLKVTGSVNKKGVLVICLKRLYHRSKDKNSKYQSIIPISLIHVIEPVLSHILLVTYNFLLSKDLWENTVKLHYLNYLIKMYNDSSIQTTFFQQYRYLSKKNNQLSKMTTVCQPLEITC